MNKLLKVALIGGGAMVLSQVWFDLGKISIIQTLKGISPEVYDSIMETLADMLEHDKLNTIDNARINFIFHLSSSNCLIRKTD